VESRNRSGPGAADGGASCIAGLAGDSAPASGELCATTEGGVSACRDDVARVRSHFCCDLCKLALALCM